MTATLCAFRACKSDTNAANSQISATLQRWRRQVAGRTDLAERRGVRPFALVGHRISGNVRGSLVPLDKLSFVALFDERDEEDRLATRLVGCRARLNAEHLLIGGAESSLFDKNVRLAPAGACGGRLDPRDGPLCELALSWEQHLERVNRHPHFPRRNLLRWPQWWCRVNTPAADVPTHDVDGQRLVRLETAVAGRLPIVAVYADVAGVPKRQVLAGTEPRRLLCGVQGDVVFDLYHSRFRRAD
ncbi:MAG: hypothetical protein C0483_11185 [Pirellula sp.]|nr:hypothetical protein [Pirellula sp.]